MKKEKSKLEKAKEDLYLSYVYACYTKESIRRKISNLVRLAKAEKKCGKCGTDLLCPNCNLT